MKSWTRWFSLYKPLSVPGSSPEYLKASQNGYLRGTSAALNMAAMAVDSFLLDNRSNLSKKERRGVLMALDLLDEMAEHFDSLDGEKQLLNSHDLNERPQWIIK